MVESLESLKAFCAEHNRAVPMPPEWNRLFEMLTNKRRTPTGGWEPALPLVLGAWWDSIPIAKVLRFQEHLAWAEREGQLQEVGSFLRSLSEDQWAHFGELPT